MNELQTAESHTILPVERLGDTLLVVPHGDLGGFSQRVFQTEYQRLQKVLDDASLKHLIVDLSGSRYFGSEMLGALVALRERVVERGGRAALTDVSRDMLAGLDVIGVDGLFEVFNTRADAVSALASLTVGQRVQRHRRPIKWGLILTVAGGMIWGVHASKIGYELFGSRTARVYEQLAREWTRFDAQSQRWTQDEARTYRSELLDRLASVENSLKQTRLIPERESKWLLNSVSHFQLYVRSESEEEKTEFLRAMYSSHNLITQRTALKIPQLPLPGDVEIEDSAGAKEPAESSDRPADEPPGPRTEDDRDPDARTVPSSDEDAE